MKGAGVPSPFLDRPVTDWIVSNDLAFAIRDAFPVSPGHTLVVPRRQFASWFEATREEQAAIWALVEKVKASSRAARRAPTVTTSASMSARPPPKPSYTSTSTSSPVTAATWTTHVHSRGSHHRRDRGGGRAPQGPQGVQRCGLACIGVQDIPGVASATSCRGPAAKSRKPARPMPTSLEADPSSFGEGGAVLAEAGRHAAPRGG